MTLITVGGSVGTDDGPMTSQPRGAAASDSNVRGDETERAAVPMSGQILDAAADLFFRRGYHAVGIRELADAVGISTSTLYHYYRNKQDILFAIISRFLVDFTDLLIPVLRDTSTPPSQRLERVVVEHVLLSVRRSRELLVGNAVINALTPEQQAAVAGWRRRYRDAFRDVLVEGVRSGEFSVKDPLLTAMATLDMLDGIRDWYHEGGPLGLDELAERYREQAFALFRSGALS
jgi:AcrR family transcriptional regulator